jgi:hypothetical protein
MLNICTKKVNALYTISKCVACGCSCLFCLDVSTEMHLFCKISHPVDIVMQGRKLFTLSSVNFVTNSRWNEREIFVSTCILYFSTQSEPKEYIERLKYAPLLTIQMASPDSEKNILKQHKTILHKALIHISNKIPVCIKIIWPIPMATLSKA